MILLLPFLFICMVAGQGSQWIDSFQKTICHDRWSQMDWQSIIRPCRHNNIFGKNVLDEKQRTSPKWSHTLGLHFQKTGEFSKIAIQSRTAEGRNKVIGGDTWRVFIRGADQLTPFVSDMNNGVYETKFIALQPGFYKAEIALESSLCEALKDPPQDWLKRDAKTILMDEKNEKLIWEPIRGGNISFKIEGAPESAFIDLKNNFRRWKNSCGSQYNCDLLWNGFGRWVNSTWIPYIDDTENFIDIDDETEACYKHKEGVLKITGDELTQKLNNYIEKSDLCSDIFTKCIGNEKGEQPESSTLKETKQISIKTYLQALKELLKKDFMNEESGLLINYGNPFAQNIGFKQYRSFIDRTVKILKAKYKGKAIWRTMASKWRDSLAPEDHFKNHQRIKLFNAYATSVMCNAGIPVLDVFQMTESAPSEDAVMKSIKNILTKYFKQHPLRECIKKTQKIKKINNLITPDTENNFKALLEKASSSESSVNSINNATVSSLFTIL
ncbi:uncharacterized protein LOC100211432 isoform X1 [Hydra vulgaris]|nr:uncharacterized protein LOC100211432 isoform X2 [Hydra vulgaris]